MHVRFRLAVLTWNPRARRHLLESRHDSKDSESSDALIAQFSVCRFRHGLVLPVLRCRHVAEYINVLLWWQFFDHLSLCTSEHYRVKTPVQISLYTRLDSTNG